MFTNPSIAKHDEDKELTVMQWPAFEYCFQFGNFVDATNSIIIWHCIYGTILYSVAKLYLKDLKKTENLWTNTLQHSDVDHFRL